MAEAADLQISDRTAPDLEHKMLDPGVSEGSDAVDLAVEQVDVLGPFVDGFLAGSSSSSARTDCVGCSEFQNDPEGRKKINEEKLSDRDQSEAEDEAEYYGSDDQEQQDQQLPGRPSCSRSSTFSERSVDSCDSFVSASSRLEPYAERQELNKMFNAFDENGDGKISCEELGNTMRKLGYQMTDSELQSMVVAVDNDGDGFVDFDEFLALYSSLYYDEENHKARLDVLEDETELQEAFAVFDKNNDGYITVVELQAVLSSLGLKEGAKLLDCQKMIKAVDADGDGRVNFDEFKNMMSSALFKQG